MDITLITQKTQTECAVASVAMVLKLDYDYVLNVAYISKAKDSEDVGTHTSTLLNALDVHYKSVYDHNGHHGKAFWKDLLWGRRAVLSVKSANVEDGKHLVAWAYHKVLDPQEGNEDKKFFSTLEEMEIETAYLLCECGCDPTQKWKIEKIDVQAISS